MAFTSCHDDSPQHQNISSNTKQFNVKIERLMFCKAIWPNATLFVSTCSVSRRKTRLSIIWPCHSFISYAILQLILTPSLYLLIYLTSLYFWWWQPPIKVNGKCIIHKSMHRATIKWCQLTSSIKHIRCTMTVVVSNLKKKVTEFLRILSVSWSLVFKYLLLHWSTWLASEQFTQKMMLTCSSRGAA